MEAIVLAGGFGTRLQKLVSDVPKSMARINQRPFLEYLFDHLIVQGVTRVVLSVGYQHEAISGHFHDRYKALSISYAIENEPMGTGGGIRLALWKIDGLRALVLNGDTMFRFDYRTLMEFHMKKKADATLALRRLDDTGRFGKVTLKRGGRITGFEESGNQGGPGLVNGGVYVIEKYFLMEPWYRGHFSLEKDCFERSFRESKFYGLPSEGYFLDIGIPEDYLKAQHEFAAFKD
jgi:D-glycero-alpha-D-manno-heptose 1-phosphate guanylyltransferase